MPKIPLRKPITHDGETFSAIEFDPSLGALEDFEAQIRAGVSEMTAMIDLIASDGDIPREVARRIRQSDLEAVQAEMKPADPLASSTATGEPGAPSRPMLHTS